MRFWLAAFLIIVLLAVGLAVRILGADWVVQRAMGVAGLDNPRSSVTAFSLDHIRIEDASAGVAGDDDLFIDAIEIDFDWREALFQRRVKAVRLGPGLLRLNLNETGDLGTPFRFGGGGGGGASPSTPPFDQLEVSGLEVVVDTPTGPARVLIDGAFDMATGGDASARFSAERASYLTYEAANLVGEASIELAPSGVAAAQGDFSGDLRTPFGTLQAIGLGVTANAEDWRRLLEGERGDAKGSVEISLREAGMPLAEGPMAAMLGEYASAAGAGALNWINLAGAVEISYDRGAIEASLDDAPLTLTADNGSRLSITSFPGDPFYFSDADGAVLAAVMDARGGGASMSSAINAQRDGAIWRVMAPFHFGAFASKAVNLDEGAGVFDARLEGETAAFVLSGGATIARAAIGRLRLRNTPIEAAIEGAVDLSSGAARVDLVDGYCARLDKSAFAITGQDTEGAFDKARICAAYNAPLLTITPGPDGPLIEFAGVIDADSARYRLGESRFSGVPPTMRLAGAYQPALNATTANGVATGGIATFNDLVRFSDADATFQFKLDRDLMTIVSDIERIRIADVKSSPLYGPFVGDGSLALEGDAATFDYALRAQSGEAIGAGRGEHNTATSTGRMTFSFPDLAFSPGGLQPTDLAPVLRGIIGQTRGAAGGEAVFSWSEAGVESRGLIAVDNISFNGPGITISRTLGVAGDIAFARLWPVKTNGPQTLTVEGIDAGALQLFEGEIRFDLPGDDTLSVERAVFPWFGGEIGVSDADANFDGGQARALLGVSNVDLGALLEYVDVNGLSGEGTLTGVLPLEVNEGRASIVEGSLQAVGPGAIRYVGAAGEEAAAASGQSKIAFDLLRDLRFDRMGVEVEGPLDGRLNFLINFEGTGPVTLNNATSRIPVKYNITLDAALLELLNQANLSRNIQLQIERAVAAEQ
ncbi:MAG: YdbH domain-containing protein [Pseudomonadota bacterium]